MALLAPVTWQCSRRQGEAGADESSNGGDAIYLQERIGASSRGAEDRDGQVLWLVLSSVSADIELRLLELGELVLDAIEASLQPIGVNVSDQEIRQLSAELQPLLLPSYNCARHLCGWPWRDAEGRQVVPVRAMVPPRSGVPLWPRERGTEDSRAKSMRFAAWSASRGVLLRCQSEGAVRRMRQRLEGYVSRLESPPAILVDRRANEVDRALVDWVRLQALAERARRMVRKRWTARPGDRGIARSLIAGLATLPPRAPVLPWLTLTDRELFVAPKLSSLARLRQMQALLDEVAHRADAPFSLAGRTQP